MAGIYDYIGGRTVTRASSSVGPRAVVKLSLDALYISCSLGTFGKVAQLQDGTVGYGKKDNTRKSLNIN